MFRRRGCLFGCGSLLLICVVFGLLGWFVALPRLTDALEDSVSDGMSTVIADQIETVYNPAELQNGTQVEFSFATINRELAAETTEGNVQNLEITSSGNQIVLRAESNGQTFEFGFIPTVTNDGRIELEPAEDGGWWERQFVGILSGGFEKSINGFLERNNLVLTGIELDGDTMILDVTGE